jgi:hypothetical protein
MKRLSMLKAALAGFGLCAGLFVMGHVVLAEDQPAAASSATPNQAETAAPAAPKDGDQVLELKLPKPAYIGTPKAIPPGTTALKPSAKPRPAFYVPKGTKNLAKGKPVTASDSDPTIGSLKMITDGDKEGQESSLVELGPGKQWVQIDLQKESDIYAIVIWHRHDSPRIYKAVVVQVSDDPDFINNVQTVYNNDHENSAGLGIGKNRQYFEHYEGFLVPANDVKGRYVRLYSKGSTDDDMNHYTEVEVYGIQK